MDDKQIAARLEAEDAFWDGPRLIALLFGTLAVALVVIYVISSLKSGDYSWRPFAHDHAREMPIADW